MSDIFQRLDRAYALNEASEFGEIIETHPEIVNSIEISYYDFGCKDIKFTKFLYEKGLFMSYMPQIFLDACHDGNIDIVEYLIDKIDKDLVKQDAIMKACASGDVNVLKYLFSQGFTVDFTSEKYPDSPFEIRNYWTTTRTIDSDIVHCLAQHGVDLNIRVGKRNYTLLHIACAYGDEEIINILLSYGVDKTILNDYGQKASDLVHHDLKHLF